MRGPDDLGQRVEPLGVVPCCGALEFLGRRLLRRLQHPEQVDDKTAMSNTGVTETEARDIAAYLYTRR